MLAALTWRTNLYEVLVREIKFRAWDEQAKTMHHNFQCIKSGDLNTGGSDWVIPLEPITNEGWVARLTQHCAEKTYFRDQFKLMQYTGLKDKKDIEIYEGDIVLIKGVVDRGDGTYDDAINFVSFIEGSWCVYQTENCREEYLEYLNDGIEVIGNIYENVAILGPGVV